MCGNVVIDLYPSDTSEPNEASGAGTPSPKKERYASRKIALGIENIEVIIT